MHQDTVVVAAKMAWPEYQQYAAYICQPYRSFRQSMDRLAFYSLGKIEVRVPRIRARRENVQISAYSAGALSASPDTIDQRIGALVKKLLADGRREEGTASQIFLLTGYDDEETLKLRKPVFNTSLDHRGNTCAWTYAQRYTFADILATGPASTDELQQHGG